MRKSNIIIKKVRNLMILSMAVIVIISVYFNILNSRAKETTDIVANVTDETGEVDSQKVTLVATGNKNGNYEISLPETISNVYVSNYKTLNGDKSANDKIVLSQDEVENKEINLEVNYDKKNVTSTKTNEEMTLYKQNLEYDDKGIYVEGYMPLLAQINVIQNENDISLEILYTVVESNNMSTKEIYVPSEYEQTLKITLNKKKYGVEQSLISSTDAEYIVVEQSDSKLVINNISSNTINITNEEVPTIISSQYNGEDNKYYFAGGPIANSQIESIKFVTNPKEVLGTKWDASENGDNSVIAGYIDSNGNELYEIYVASNSDKTTKVYTPEDASYMFYECSNLTTIDIQNLGTSKTTNMNSMFAMCTNITTLELQNFDTSNVEDMENMFFGCENLETLDISNFITAKVTTMCNMFQNCKKLTELNLESFDTSKVIDMNSMFNGCESLTILNLNNFNTTEVTDMSWMFYNCKNITTLDLSNFDTSNVIDMSAMFSTCENLTTLNISNFNTSQVTNMSYMFNRCVNLTSLDVRKFDTSQVTDMSYMFSEGEALETLDVSKFDTSQVTNMGAMFYNCSRLTSLDVSEFDTSQVTDMGHMFSNCNGLTNLDVSKFDTSQVTNMKAMFQACRKLIELNISNFNTSQVTNMSYMFCNCSSLRSIYVSEYNETTGKGWTTKNVTDSDNMFTGATKLVGGNGTVYNSSYIDATYARIDKEAEPGYLTKSVKGTTFDKDEKIFISGEAVTIPAGMTVSSFKGEFESIDQGIVIYRLNGDVPDWTNKTKMQETYDQFVWVPVKNAILDLSSTYSGLDYAGLISKVQEQINVGKYPMAIKTNTAGDYIGVLYEFSEVTENNTTYVKVIPNSKWKPKSKKANLNYIEMDSKREPGGLTSSTYGDTETNLKQINGILNTSYNSTTSFKSALQSQYNEMVKKVEEKGGFWVGRYETSSMSNSTTENYIASNRIQVSSKRNTTNGIGDVTWYKMYAQQKIYSELALESKTTSSMIWGSQYDQIMIWMKGEKSSDQASSRGKYYVTNGAGKGNYGTISGVENDVYSGIAPTGSQDIYSIKNIFDLAGNVFEWSLEASMTAFRVERGGSYYDTDAYYTRPDDRYSQRPSYP